MAVVGGAAGPVDGAALVAVPAGLVIGVTSLESD